MTPEKCYTVQELSALLKLSDTKIRRLFENELGVLRIGSPSRRLGRKLKRRYYTLRIPESVAAKVCERLATSKGGTR